MLPNFAKTTSVQTVKRGVIASVLALSLALPAAPAMAWGQREQDTLKGALGALVIGSLIMSAQNNQAKAQPQVVHQPPRQGGAYGRHYYQEPRPHYQEPVSIYRTPAARAFSSYSHGERRLIQRRLAVYGYYRGGIDGSFGPGTYSAVVAYANANRQSRQLRSTTTAYAVYDGLIY